MNAERRLLRASIAIAVAATIAAVAAPAQAWLRLPLGLPLVVLLPGYGLLRALHPDAGRDAVMRFTISVAASISLVVFLGLAMHAVGIRIATASWTIALATLTVGADYAALVRLRPAAQAPVTPGVPTPLAAAGVLAAFVLAGSVALSVPYSFAPASGEIVQLWAMPGDAMRPHEITVGVRNDLSRTHYFRLIVTHADQLIADKALYLPPGTDLVFSIHTPAALSALTPVRAVLTAEGNASAERMVAIWPEALASTRTIDASRGH